MEWHRLDITSGRFCSYKAHRIRNGLPVPYTNHAGEEVVPPYAMPWYPNKLAWHMNFSRTQLRKMHVLQALHEFIKREHGVGSISRQEAVSMVPPLFLDVQPHHTVRLHAGSLLSRCDASMNCSILHQM